MHLAYFLSPIPSLHHLKEKPGTEKSGRIKRASCPSLGQFGFVPCPVDELSKEEMNCTKG